MKNKSENKPWSGAQPFILGGASTLQNTYDANSGNIQSQADMLSGQTTGLLDRFQNGSPVLNAASDYNTDVLSGSYLNNNPHLDEMIGFANDDITDSVNAMMGARGLTGGSDHAKLLAREIGRNSSNIRYGDYARERSAMDGAAGRAPGLDAASFNPLNAALNTSAASMMPLQAASGLAGGLGGLLGGYGSQTQQNSIFDTLVGAAGTGAAAFAASERRVKRDITQIGSLDDGLNIYNFRYVWDADDAPLHTGVMVDEVETLRPWALGPIVDGIQTVDYSNLEAA